MQSWNQNEEWFSNWHFFLLIGCSFWILHLTTFSKLRYWVQIDWETVSIVLKTNPHYSFSRPYFCIVLCTKVWQQFITFDAVLEHILQRNQGQHIELPQMDTLHWTSKYFRLWSFRVLFQPEYIYSESKLLEPVQMQMDRARVYLRPYCLIYF